VSRTEILNPCTSPKNNINNTNFKNNNYDNTSDFGNNYNNKELWSYVFRLQNTYLEETHQSENQKKTLTYQLDRQNKIVKQLMKEKSENDSYKGYSAMAQYMEVMDSNEVLEIIKGAKEYKNTKALQRKMEDMKKEYTEKIDILTKEKLELMEEINNLKSELDNTKNESIYFQQLLKNVVFGDFFVGRMKMKRRKMSWRRKK